MTPPEPTAPSRIGRPPKVDRHGTPTRERLLTAAADACVEFGYEGATLADIARRADVSTPAIYSHFSGKADLLVEACQRELNTISSGRLREVDGLRELAQAWIQPDFARSRIMVAEIHCAAIRQPEVADAARLLATRHGRRTREPRRADHGRSEAVLPAPDRTGAPRPGARHRRRRTATRERELSTVLEGWLGERYRDR